MAFTWTLRYIYELFVGIPFLFIPTEAVGFTQGNGYGNKHMDYFKKWLDAEQQLSGSRWLNKVLFNESSAHMIMNNYAPNTINIRLRTIKTYLVTAHWCYFVYLSLYLPANRARGECCLDVTCRK